MLEALGKPRNIYYSLVIMLTIVTGLASITFSYYVDESKDGVEVVSLSVVDNQIQSDELVDNKIIIPANKSKSFNIYVSSNNNYESIYKLYYLTDNDNIIVTKNKDIESIDAFDVQSLNIEIINNSNHDEEIEIGIINGYVDTTLNTPGKEIMTK